MSDPIILGVHGLGDHRDGSWIANWKSVLAEHWFGSADFDAFHDFSYDSLFESRQVTVFEHARAAAKLIGSGVQSLFRKRNAASAATVASQSRAGLFNVGHFLHWFPGYVTEWTTDEQFRSDVLKAFFDRVRDVRPQILLAHSLGSLITYSALLATDEHDDELKAIFTKLHLVTLGSQIANPFVIGGLSNGRVQMPNVRRWFHLYNSEDEVFTAPITLPGVATFQQVDTFFDDENDFADHDALQYLRHSGAAQFAWPMIREDLFPSTALATGTRKLSAKAAAKKAETRPIRRRALLVGINEYQDPGSNLQGCVNDVFLMSALLQEQGFPAEEIRVVLNERATATGILERMHWLLDDSLPHDELVFFYSGHGAQLPTYGDGDTVDRMDETLVPYDFDWSPETCVTDDKIFSLYSPLPYDTRLTMIFDCCHSGGIHRDGGPRARGITPPDDIRHRMLKWDAETQMWLPREFKPLQPDFSRDDDTKALYAGVSGSVSKLGRGMAARQLDSKQYDKAKAASKTPVGPYLPVILEACREHELAYEYRHGVESYGAFTYSLVDLIRKSDRMTFQKLIVETAKRLEKLGYKQKPCILGPTKLISQKASFVAANK